ncbi:MAG: pyridoxal-phosphate dependent enzyme [Patescibacteria group bacterium]|nr:pyridoxal-phosphate dependent enzyme [Patescibacteria group bacterium]
MNHSDRNAHANNVFTGPDAVRDFLNPGASLPTPLIELPESVNPYAKDKVRIYAKASFMGPLFNIKQLGALNLLQDAQASGKLRGVHTLVENSSGNMILGIAVLARFFGVKRVVGVVSRDIAPGKLEVLRLFGVEPEFNNETPGEQSGIMQARELGKQPGWLNLAQYENDANPQASEKWLGPDIWEQTGGALTIFCAGIGTSGTLVGSARFLKTQAPSIAVVGVIPLVDTVPGVRSPKRLKEVEIDWASKLDYRVDMETKRSFKLSLDLCRLGVLAGPSSGMAFAGLLKFIEERKAEGALDRFRNKDGEVVATFVCPDSALLYLEKYSTHLDAADLA